MLLYLDFRPLHHGEKDFIVVLLLCIIVFRLGCDRPSGLLLFVPAVLFAILTPFFCVCLRLSHPLISFLLFPCVSVWENTRA